MRCLVKYLLSLALLLAAIVAVRPGYAAEQLIVPPDEAVAGISQAEWSQAWWQWAGAFERKESPVADKTGQFCGSKQEGPVWFLAGTYGTKRTIRTCRVPAGKYLFFPLINYLFMPPVSRTVTCAAVMAKAAAMTDDPLVLILEVDGVRIDNLSTYRQAPVTCFDMGVRAEPRVRVYPSAANGYYAMLRPLSPGRHVLNFGGALPDMLQAVTYTLDVE